MQQGSPPPQWRVLQLCGMLAWYQVRAWVVETLRKSVAQDGLPRQAHNCSPGHHRGWIATCMHRAAARMVRRGNIRAAARDSLARRGPGSRAESEDETGPPLAV